MRKYFHIVFLSLFVNIYGGIFPATAVAGTNTAEVSIDQLFKKKDKKKYLTHTVNVGESLYSILERYGIPMSVVMKDNPQLLTRDIVRGEQLKINKSEMNTATPEQIKAEMAEGIRHIESISSEQETPRTEGKPDVKKPVDTKLPVSPAHTGARDTISSGDVQTIEEQEYINHTVAKGETLFGLSRQYNVTVPAIRFANQDVLQNGLKEGSVIRIPVTKQKEISDFTEYEGLADQNKYDNQVPTNRKANKNFDSPANPIQISLLLPMTDAGKPAAQFTELYQGFLMALDSLKKEGISVRLDLYDTQKSLEKVHSIISSGVLASSDIIIGPVYEKEFCEVAAYAKAQAIPIVSPLAPVGCRNPYIFQMSPDETHRYDKAKVFLKDKNIVFYQSAEDDKEFVNQIKAIIPPGYQTKSFDPKEKPESIGEMLDSNKETVFIVAANSEQQTDAMLSKLSAIKKTAFSPKPMSVFGSSKITRMNSLDPAYFFLLNLRYITSYHIDRTNEEVLKFDSNYMKTFGVVPSLYSYRGYDVAMFFIGSLKEFGSDFYSYINDYYTTILQVRYKFHQASPGDPFINEEWMMVNYTPSYNIIIN